MLGCHTWHRRWGSSWDNGVNPRIILAGDMGLWMILCSDTLELLIQGSMCQWIFSPNHPQGFLGGVLHLLSYMKQCGIGETPHKCFWSHFAAGQCPHASDWPLLEINCWIDPYMIPLIHIALICVSSCSVEAIDLVQMSWQLIAKPGAPHRPVDFFIHSGLSYL